MNYEHFSFVLYYVLNIIFHMLLSLTRRVTILELRSFIFFPILLRFMSLTTLLETIKREAQLTNKTRFRLSNKPKAVAPCTLSLLNPHAEKNF